MIVLDLLVFEGKLPSRVLAREIMPVGVFASAPVRASVWHLGAEVAMVAGYAAPTGGSSGAEEVGRFAVGGDVVEPGAVRTAAAFFVLALCQNVVLGVLAVPGDGTACPAPQMQGPGLLIGGLPPVVGSVSPCQFSSLAILVYQLQEAF
jgi:hypothetical protein